MSDCDEVQASGQMTVPVTTYEAPVPPFVQFRPNTSGGVEVYVGLGEKDTVVIGRPPSGGGSERVG